MHPIRALHARPRELPVLTHLDAANGTRIELSAATLLNNIAKTAHLLADEVHIEAGEKVLVDIPAHWQSAVWICAAWSLGASPTFSGAAPVAITTMAGSPQADEIFMTGLHAFGLPIPGGLQGTATDWSIAMRTFPDFFTPRELQDLALSHDERITAGSRVGLITESSERLAGVLADVLVHEAALVLITNAADREVSSYISQEGCLLIT